MLDRNPWFRTGLELWSLGAEAGSVIALRTMKFAAGEAGSGAEMTRMIGEKIEAGLALQAMAWSGRLGSTPQSALSKTIAHYRRTVRANERRLRKG